MNHNEEIEQDTKFDLNIWKKIFKYIVPHKKLAIYGMLAAVFVSVLDVLFPYMIKWAIDELIKTGDLGLLPLYTTIFVIGVIFQAIFIFTFIKQVGHLEVEMSYDIRKESFAKLQALSYSYYDQTSVGWIMARLTSDSRRLSEIISWGLIDLTWGFLMMIGIAIVLLFINVKLALITLSVLPFLIVITIYFRRYILKAYRQVRKINSKITGAFNEGITGAKTTKSLVLEDANLYEFKETCSSMRTYSIRAAILSSLFFPIVLILGFIGTALAINYGGNAYLSNIITYGSLYLFMTYSTQFFEPVMQLARILAEFQQAQASAERVFSLLESEIDVKDSIDVTERYGDHLQFKKENWEKLLGEIKFDNVSFKYKEGEEVLKNFNLTIPVGSTVALVGETGAGKSTIVNLICRFYEPTSGTIYIDDVDYKQRSVGWLHDNLGYVLQTPHLFSGTIMDNIRYGNLEATDEEVFTASKLVDAHRFIIDFEKGYNTEVGEGGSKLSVGQKQLISFARAILANPSILILDEATSSIDTETERLIQTAIDKLLEGRTSFIVAHRLSTVVNADIIIVLQNGEILEKGTHQELIRAKGYYYRLFTNQYIEENSQKLGF